MAQPLTGVVKAVPSGDTVIVMGVDASRGPPPEKLLRRWVDVPGCRVLVVHGQLPEAQIESRMLAFFEGEAAFFHSGIRGSDHTTGIDFSLPLLLELLALFELFEELFDDGDEVWKKWWSSLIESGSIP